MGIRLEFLLIFLKWPQVTCVKLRTHWGSIDAYPRDVAAEKRGDRVGPAPGQGEWHLSKGICRDGLKFENTLWARWVLPGHAPGAFGVRIINVPNAVAAIIACGKAAKRHPGAIKPLGVLVSDDLLLSLSSSTALRTKPQLR
ncbi:unnamed protein product [Phytomonas sp. EM1]|nr:unnamed protein product [Phytomonas sp. EM1]|eukprot:CCW63689.1 unnamed protein product [Phytomonas sp. isolate EM1]